MIRSRIIVPALALLVATAASAAVKVGPPKTIHTVGTRPSNADSVAISAAGGHRVAMWSEGNRMYVGTADHNWKIDEATILQLPTFSDEPLLQSVRPGITFNGSHFLLDWFERRMYAMGADKFERIAVRWSPRQGVIDTAPIFLEWAGGRPRPAMLWNGSEYVLVGHSGVTTFDRGMIITTIQRYGLDFLAATFGGPGKPVFIVARRFRFLECPAGICDDHSIEPMLFNAQVREMSPPGSPNRLVSPAFIAAASASANAYLAAWRDDYTLHVGAFDENVNQFGRSAITTRTVSDARLRFGWDDTQHLLVWSDADAAGRSTIHATLFGTDAKQLGETITIATDAVYPSLTELGRGQYAVAYLSGRELIVRELTTIEPGRTRAIR